MNTNNFTGFNGLEHLPMFENFIYSLHGWGIDCDWSGHCPKNGKYVYFTNSFHVMNDGFYVGWQDFTVRIPLSYFLLFIASDDLETKSKALEAIKLDFKIQFNNGHYLADYYQLKEYLEDILYLALSGLLD